MNNDFIDGMEILMRCKRYVEFKLDYLSKRVEQMDVCGKDTRGVKLEIARCQYALGYEENLPKMWEDE